jgi:hypothetical protein
MHLMDLPVYGAARDKLGVFQLVGEGTSSSVQLRHG